MRQKDSITNLCPSHFSQIRQYPNMGNTNVHIRAIQRIRSKKGFTMAEIHHYPAMGHQLGSHMKGFGERIRKIRTEQGLTVKELSQLSKVPEKTIYRVETGEVADPRLSSVIPIIKALNCSADEIIFAPTDFPQFGKLKQVFLNYGDLEDFQQDFLVEVIKKVSFGMTMESHLSNEMAKSNAVKVK